MKILKFKVKKMKKKVLAIKRTVKERRFRTTLNPSLVEFKIFNNHRLLSTIIYYRIFRNVLKFARIF